MAFENFFEKKALIERFNEKIATSRAIGSDGISAEQFAAALEENVQLVERKVNNLSYRFSPFKEKLILKDKHSTPRVIHIATVRDRLVIGALGKYVGEQFQEDIAHANTTITQIAFDIKAQLASHQFDSFLKLDIKNFFSSLDHHVLMAMLAVRIDDKRALSLLKKILHRSQNGIAQGLSIASLLSNIYMAEIDREYRARTDLRYYRFVDDFLILCRQENVQGIHDELNQKIAAIKLALHDLSASSEKTTYGRINEDTMPYLGFLFSEKGVTVRGKTVEKLRQRINRIIKAYKNKEYEPWEFYSRINLKITGLIVDGKEIGWLFIFKPITDIALLHHLDWYVKKMCAAHDIKYDPKKIKSFVKTWYEIKKINAHRKELNDYFPILERVDGKLKKVLSTEEKTPFKFVLVAPAELDKITDEKPEETAAKIKFSELTEIQADALFEDEIEQLMSDWGYF